MTSKKSVKVYARVVDPKTGETTLRPIGSSHPGEIRLMRKNGLAEWIEGKVILNLIPSSDASESPKVDQESPKIDQEFPRAWSHMKGFRIDPDTGEIAKGDFETNEIVCSSAAEWFLKIAEERLAGHTLYPSDDIRSMRMGFVSDEANTSWTISIGKLRSTTPEDVTPMAQFGLDYDKVMQSIRTEEGRNLLIGNTDTIFSSSVPLPPFSQEETPADAQEGGDAESIILDSGSGWKDGASFWESVLTHLEYIRESDRKRELRESRGHESAERQEPKSDDHDSPRHMTGNSIPVLPYSFINRALEVELRKDFEVVCGDSESHKIPDETPSFGGWEPKIPTEPGWARISYPKEWSRVPLLVPKGDTFVRYERGFEGFFRRDRNGVEIRTEEGVRIHATKRQNPSGYEVNTVQEDSED